MLEQTDVQNARHKRKEKIANLWIYFNVIMDASIHGLKFDELAITKSHFAKIFKYSEPDSSKFNPM